MALFDKLIKDKRFEDLIKSIISKYLDSFLDKKIENYIDKFVRDNHKEYLVQKLNKIDTDLIKLLQIKGDIDSGN